MIDDPRSEAEPPAQSGPLAVRERLLPLEPLRRAFRLGRDTGPDIGLMECVHILHRRRWRVVAVIAACVAATAAYNVLATPLYEARARLLIEPGYPQIVTFRPVVTEDQSTRDYYRTQYEVLRSRALARKTLEKLGLWNEEPTAQARQINAFLSRLTVSPVTESRLVDIRFRSPDPEYAARVANGLSDVYIEQNLDSRVQASRDASKWLTEKLAELRQQVDTSEGALQQYREDRDAVSLEDRQNIVVQKLAQLNAAVTTAREERIGKETLYAQLRAIDEGGAALDTFPLILSNAFIQGLKAELAGLQRERAQHAEQLGSLHPEMIKVETAIATAEGRLKAEIGKVADGIRNEFRAAQAKERGLLAALEEQKQEVLDLNRTSIGYGVLQRDAASTQQIFEGVLQRVKEADLSGALQSNNVRILDVAEVPTAAVWPRTRLNLMVALFGGTLVGIGLVIGVERLRTRIDTPDDIGDALGLPVLGITPRIAGPTDRLARLDGALPPVFQEALRGIRARILLSPIASAVRTLAVTSTSAGEGKTSVASNLAISMALSGRRVLLVDSDLRRPRLHALFNVSRSPGLSDLVAGRASVGAALRETTVKGLFVLPAGNYRESPADLLDNAPFRQLIQGLSEGFDLVVLDSPPVMAVADASIIANAASAVLFVVGAGATSREVAQAAIDRLTAAQAQVIGVVLNKADLDRRDEYFYPYYRREDSEYYVHPHSDPSDHGARRAI